MKGHYVHTGTIRDINTFNNISKRIVKNLYRISDYSKRYNPLVSMRYADNGYTHGAFKEMKTASNHSKNKYEIFRLEFLERTVSRKLSYSSIRLKSRHIYASYNVLDSSLFRRRHIRTMDNIVYSKYSSDPKTMKELCIMINNDEEADSEEE